MQAAVFSVLSVSRTSSASAAPGEPFDYDTNITSASVCKRLFGGYPRFRAEYVTNAVPAKRRVAKTVAANSHTLGRLSSFDTPLNAL